MKRLLSGIPAESLFVTLALVLALSLGMYSPYLILLLTCVVAYFVWIKILNTDKEEHLTSNSENNVFVVILLLLFLLWLIRQPSILYASPIAVSEVTDLLGWALFSIVLCLTVKLYVPYQKNLPAFFAAAAVVILFAVRFLVLKISPTPQIDVFETTQIGAQALLDGKNPYTQTYPDMYKGAYGCKQMYPYLPFYIVWSALFKTFGDVRYGNFTADVITALCFFVSFGGAKLKDWVNERNLLWLSLWLAFPVGLFVLEQAWTDSTFIALLAVFYLFLSKKAWLPAGIALGLLLATKHYGVLVAPFAILACWRTESQKQFYTFCASIFLTFALFTLPFFLWSPSAFLESIRGPLGCPARLDAFSLLAFSDNALKVVLPTEFYFAATAAFGFWSVHRFYRLPQKEISDWTVQLSYAIAVFAVTFLLGRQAFCNYYYVVAYLVFLSVAQRNLKQNIN